MWCIKSASSLNPKCDSYIWRICKSAVLQPTWSPHYFYAFTQLALLSQRKQALTYEISHYPEKLGLFTVILGNIIGQVAKSFYYKCLILLF